MNNRILFILLLLCTCYFAIAQESVNASGGMATGTGGSASFSIGQVTYQSFTGNGLTELQGVQQPFEVGAVTNIFAPTITNKIQVFPNPTNGVLNVQIDQFLSNQFNYQIVDVHGKLLLNKNIQLGNSQINLSNLPAATYYLKIIKKNGEIKTFKIVKAE